MTQDYIHHHPIFTVFFLHSFVWHKKNSISKKLRTTLHQLWYDMNYKRARTKVKKKKIDLNNWIVKPICMQLSVTSVIDSNFLADNCFKNGNQMVEKWNKYANTFSWQIFDVILWVIYTNSTTYIHWKKNYYYFATQSNFSPRWQKKK